MKITFRSLLAGARRSSGLTVIIDVYRAFSCAPLLISMGVEKILFAASPGEALHLKANQPELLLAGELDGKPIAGFDYDNSPYRLLVSDPQGFMHKTVVQRTSAGVQGVIAALRQSSPVLLGSYNLAAATANWIAASNPREVTLVAMGWNGLEPSPEDEWCARYIAFLLGEGDYDHRQALREIIRHKATQKFFRREATHFPAEDPLLCLQRDICDFALSADTEEGRIVVRRKPIATAR
jgi:2-phosphosulfolactate phosphatase